MLFKLTVVVVVVVFFYIIYLSKDFWIQLQELFLFLETYNPLFFVFKMFCDTTFFFH